MAEQQWTTVIKPKTGWFDLHLAELLKYRDLIFLFVKRNFVAQYKQTILGPAWAIVQPLLTTVMFTIVFGNLAGLSPSGVPSFLFYMSGNIAWGYFAGCFTSTANTFVQNAGIYGKVYFPRLVVPVSVVITGFISFAIQAAFFICFWIYYIAKGDISPNYEFLFLVPLLLIQMALLSLGFGIIASALTTKYRDLTMLISFGVSLWMYATPVAYDISRVGDKYMSLYMLNPMTPIIQTFRSVLLGTGEINFQYLLISVLVTAAVLFLGIVLFSRVEKTFMDTV